MTGTDNRAGSDIRFSWKFLADYGQKMWSIRRYYLSQSGELTNLFPAKIEGENSKKKLDVLYFGCSQRTGQLK